MQVPLKISFRNLEHSDALDFAIRKKVDQLEKFCPNITAVRVTAGLQDRSSQKGNLFSVRIDLSVPGGQIVVNRDPPKKQAHQDAYIALRDAFRAARRQLEDFVRMRKVMR